MDDVTARITVAVEAGDSLRRLGEVENGVKAVTAARNEDFQVAKQTASASTDQTAKEKQSDEEIVRLLWEKAKAARAHNEELMKAGQYSQYSGLATGADSVAHLNKQLSGQEPILSEADKAAAAELKKIEAANTEVNQRIKDRQNLTKQELAIERAAAQVELADYRAKLATLKAYNAELELTAAGKKRAAAIKMGASPETLLQLNNDYSQREGEYVEAQAEEENALASVEQAVQKYTTAINGNGKAALSAVSNLKGFREGMLIIRQALIQVSHSIPGLGGVFSGLSRNFGTLGVIAMGVSAAIKIAGKAIEAMQAKFKGYIDELASRTGQMSQSADRTSQMHEKRQADIRRLDELQNKRGSLNFTEMDERNRLIDRLSRAYGNFDIQIDESTGKIKGWDKIYQQWQQTSLDQTVNARAGYIDRLKNELNELNNQRRNLEYKVNNPLTAWLAEPRMEWVMNRMREINDELSNAQDKLTGARQEQHDFSARDILLERELNRGQATKQERDSFRIQEMRINGMDREAKLAEVTAKWEAQRAKYGEGVKKLIDEEMKLYDMQAQKQKEQTKKDFDREMESFRIQEMRLDGMDREAKLAEVTAKWEAQRNKYGDDVDKLIEREMEIYDMEEQKRRANAVFGDFSLSKLAAMLGESSPGVDSDKPQKTTAENSRKQVSLLSSVNKQINKIIEKMGSGSGGSSLAYA